MNNWSFEFEVSSTINSLKEFSKSLMNFTKDSLKESKEFCSWQTISWNKSVVFEEASKDKNDE